MTPPTAGKKFSIFTVLRALRRRKLFILLPVLLVTPAVYYYTQHLPERFRSKALVAAEPGPGGLGRPAGALNVQDHLREIREILLNAPVLESVIREFHLYDPATREDTNRAVEAMKSRIQIQVDGPDAFYIGFEGDRKDQVAEVANRLASKFVASVADSRGRRVQQQDTFLDGEVARLRAQLNQQEEGMKAYRQSVAQQLPEFLTANLKQLDDLQHQVQAKTDQIAELEAHRSAVTDELKALDKARVLEDEPAALTPNEIALADIRLKLKQLKTKYTPEYPEIKRTEKEIQDLESSATPAKRVTHQPNAVQLRYVSLQAELKSIEPRLVSYQQERERLTAQTRELEQRVNSAPAYQTSLSGRARDMEVTRTRYEALLAKQQEAKLTQRAEQTNDTPANGDSVIFRIAEPAQAPAAPYSPRRLPIVLAGFLASLGLGIGAAFVMERANDTYNTSEEFEDANDFPVLASVPAFADVPEPGKRTPRPEIDPAFEDSVTPEQVDHFLKQCLPVLTDPQSVASQQYGILALKVCHWMQHTGGKIVGVTSSSGAEGKSVTALNLALALAASQEDRVLLIDCDLRLPQVEERLGLKTGKGFSELLAGSDSNISSYISKVGKLDVIAGGIPPANPVRLLASKRAREIFAHLREEYRLIVLDGPPIVPVADSHLLAGMSDGVVLVVRARKTRPSLFQRAVESLDAPNVIGVVLNDVEYADTPYAYAYKYYRQHYLGRS